MTDDDSSEASDVASIVIDLCLNKPLYTTLPDPKKDGERRIRDCLADDTVQFDCYCIHCKRDSLFRAVTPHAVSRSITSNPPTRQKSTRYIDPNFIRISFLCGRVPTHIYSYFFRYAGEIITKIGQFPTYEDIFSADLAPYRNILDREDFSELRKAGGLFSHDVSIGAFVYLRRIFERMLQRHYDGLEEARRNSIDWNALRIEERIKEIADSLPESLVENRNIYSILSKGIHSLQEDECKRFFPVVRAGIIAILEEDRQRRAKAMAAEALRRSISDIVAEINQPSATESK